MKKLTKEERLWNFLVKKVGRRKSYAAKKIYQYVMKNYSPPIKTIQIKYEVDSSALTETIKRADGLKRSLRAFANL